MLPTRRLLLNAETQKRIAEARSAKHQEVENWIADAKKKWGDTEIDYRLVEKSWINPWSEVSIIHDKKGVCTCAYSVDAREFMEKGPKTCPCCQRRELAKARKKSYQEKAW